MRSSWNGVTRKNLFAFRVNHHQLWMQVFPVLNHHMALLVRLLVQLRFDRDPLDHVAKLYQPRFFGNDRHIVRIPCHYRFPLLDLGIIPLVQYRSNNHVVRLNLAPVIIVNRDIA